MIVMISSMNIILTKSYYFANLKINKLNLNPFVYWIFKIKNNVVKMIYIDIKTNRSHRIVLALNLPLLTWKLKEDHNINISSVTWKHDLIELGIIKNLNFPEKKYF